MWKGYPILPLSNTVISVLAVLIVWSVIWKGLALWRAAKNNHLAWFVVMLIVNTAGILEIIYYFTVGKKRPPTM